MRKLSWAKNFKAVSRFTSVLWPDFPATMTAGIYYINRGVPEHNTIERNPAENGWKFSRGPSLFLKINGVMRERNFKSRKLTFEVSGGLEPLKCCTLNRPSGPPERSCSHLLELRAALFLPAQKQIFSPHWFVSPVCALVLGLSHGNATKVVAGEWGLRQALRTEGLSHLHRCSDDLACLADFYFCPYMTAYQSATN